MKKILLSLMGVAIAITTIAAVPHLEKKSVAAKAVKKERVHPVMAKQMAVPERVKWAKATKADRGPKKAVGAVEAFYMRPRGAFYMSGTTAGYGSYSSSILMYPLRDVTFHGQATEGATAMNWKVQYFAKQGTTWARTWDEVEGEDLVWGWLDGESDSVPQFTVTAGHDAATYFINGSYQGKEYTSYLYSFPEYNDPNEPDETYGESYAAASYMALRPRVPTISDWANYSNASVGVADGEDWEAWFGKNAQGYDHVAAGFEKPSYPYAVKKGVIDYSAIATADVPLYMYIIKVKEQPSEENNWVAVLGDTIASAEGILPKSAAESIKQNKAEDGWVEFYFKEVDGELTYDIEPEIDDDIVVVLTGYDVDEVQEFTLSIPTDNMGDNYVTAGYLGGKNEDGELKLISLEHFFQSLVVKSAPSIFLDVAMPFMVYNYNVENGEYHFPNAGGIISKTYEFSDGSSETLEGISIYSYKSSEDWMLTDAKGEDLPEWLNVELTDELDEDEEFAGTVQVDVTAEPLPEGVKGRKCDIKFSYPGASLIYHVTQGDVPEFYVSGDFNEWATDEALKMEEDEETGKFVATVEMEANKEFKIIVPDGDDWKWYGGIDENQVGYFEINAQTLNVSIDLVDGSNFRVVEAGEYTLTVDPEAMTIVVTKKAPEFLVGDVNGDGEVGIADLTMLVSLVMEGTSNERSDVNGDGETGVADVTFLVNILLNQGN